MSGRGPALAAAALAALASARTARPAGPGAVDWSRRVVRCAGQVAPDLRASAGNVATAREASARAVRREVERVCLRAIGQVQVGAGLAAAELLARDPALEASAERIVRRSRRAGETFFHADGGATVRVEVPLDGELAALLLERAAGPSPDRAAPRAATPGAAPRGAPTGLVVDATGLALAPALAPRLLDPAGAPVYDLRALDPAARAGGGAAYVAPGAEAGPALERRVGAAPRRVRAVAARGTDLVLSEGDAAAVRGIEALSRGRVAIVIGQAP